jgi:hypothetical protein
VLVIVALGGGLYWLARSQPWRNGNGRQVATEAAGAGHGSASGAGPPGGS